MTGSKPRAIRKRNGLKIAFLNIVSLRKDRHELSIILKGTEIDIVGLCETRINDKIKDFDVSILGYQIYRNDRDSKGVRVAIYEKEILSRPSVKSQSDSQELLCLEVAPEHGESFYLVCWYHPPTPGIDTLAFNTLTETLKKSR